MIPAEHPCLSAQAHFRYGRIHLPVAPRCNIRCGYCDRRYDCANESRPGVTSEVISPEAALDRVERALRLDSPNANQLFHRDRFRELPDR